MYNIHSHYETIFHALSSIVTHRRVLYLHPYGATQPEDIEVIADDISKFGDDVTDGPLFIFYDQEPIIGEFNYVLFDHIRDNCQGPFILVTTERDSQAVDAVKARYNWPVVYYFHHAFAAHDWYRGYRYDSRLVPPQERSITKKYITFNRLTSNSRVYRSLLISELVERDILDQGHVSYNDVCPDNGYNYATNLMAARDAGLISDELVLKTARNIVKAPLPLRVDYQDQDTIPNHSFMLSAVSETQESFCYVVTETCYWETKCHLTEKVFKPIVSKMPFILVAPAFNLEYLKSYGFKTFDRWWNEDYDFETDPIKRLQKISDVIEHICSYTNEQLEDMLKEMQPILEHNYNLFYSNEFLDHCWDELVTNLRHAANEV